MVPSRRPTWLHNPRALGLEQAPELCVRTALLDHPGVFPDLRLRPETAEGRGWGYDAHLGSGAPDRAVFTLLQFDTFYGIYLPKQVPCRISCLPESRRDVPTFPNADLGIATASTWKESAG